MIRNDRIWLRRVLLIGCLLVALIHLLLLAWQKRNQSTEVAEGRVPVITQSESAVYAGGLPGPRTPQLFRLPRRTR